MLLPHYLSCCKSLICFWPNFGPPVLGMRSVWHVIGRLPCIVIWRMLHIQAIFRSRWEILPEVVCGCRLMRVLHFAPCLGVPIPSRASKFRHTMLPFASIPLCGIVHCRLWVRDGHLLVTRWRMFHQQLLPGLISLPRLKLQPCRSLL